MAVDGGGDTAAVASAVDVGLTAVGEAGPVQPDSVRARSKIMGAMMPCS